MTQETDAGHLGDKYRRGRGRREFLEGLWFKFMKVMDDTLIGLVSLVL
jgi:hypothetical protein